MEAKRIRGTPWQIVSQSPSAVPTEPPPITPLKSIAESAPDQPRGLFQFNLTHPTLPGTISVTVHSDAANARGLAYLIAEEFCALVIGQIKQE